MHLTQLCRAQRFSHFDHDDYDVDDYDCDHDYDDDDNDDNDEDDDDDGDDNDDYDENNDFDDYDEITWKGIKWNGGAIQRSASQPPPCGGLHDDLLHRVAKCHRYGRDICVKILDCWGKKFCKIVKNMTFCNSASASTTRLWPTSASTPSTSSRPPLATSTTSSPSQCLV